MRVFYSIRNLLYYSHQERAGALFDKKWYLTNNPDVARSGVAPFAHFLRYGWREGRSPHPLFDVSWYLESNSDVRSASVNPLIHYLTHGWREGRQPHILFDSSFYLRQLPAVKMCKNNPLLHFLKEGGYQGVNPHPLFDSDWYLAQHPEVKRQKVNPLLHYLTEGAHLGYDPHPDFDTKFYIENHETLGGTGENPLINYLNTGVAESRDPSNNFDGNWYLSNYPDVATSGLNPLVHYVVKGKSEDRKTHAPDIRSNKCEVLEIPYEIIRRPVHISESNICVFVTFSSRGELKPHVQYYLESLRSCGWRTIVVVATDGAFYDISSSLSEEDGLILRLNHGWDFAAWMTAFSVFPEIWYAENVLLANDSVYGPLSQELLANVLGRIRSSSADLVALTDSYQIRHHFMSYFWNLKRSALRSPQMLSILSSIRSVKVKQDAIDLYEVTLKSSCEAAGLRIDILFPTAATNGTAINPTLRNWRELIRSGFPFVKVQALRDNLPIDVCDKANWKEELTDYPLALELIQAHLESVAAGEQSSHRASAFPPPRRRFSLPNNLTTFYGATSAVRLRYDSDLVISLPIPIFRSFQSNRRIAATVHIYYTEMMPELCSALCKIPNHPDVFISTNTEDKANTIRSFFAEHYRGKVNTAVFPNVGRNIAPLFVGFRDIISSYDYILHIHSKKSPHDRRFGDWRTYLLDNIIGDRESIQSIVGLLESTNAGIVFSDHFPPVRNLLNWGYNFDKIKSLLGSKGIDISVDLPLEFPSSAFFWAKTAAIKPLFEMDLKWEDFPDESGQIDGTLAHAIERSLLYICEASGFQWVKIAKDRKIADGRKLSIATTSFLMAAVKYAHRPLLGNPVYTASYRSFVDPNQYVATRPDSSLKPRWNLILPTLLPEKIFGGISTALKVFEQIGMAFGGDVEMRIIVTSTGVDIASSKGQRSYVLTAPGSAFDDFPKTIVDMSSPDYPGELPVRAGDMFMATAWWTAELGIHIVKQQRKYFRSAPPLVYFIQDYEIGFYNWSPNFGRAFATYGDRNCIALINSEELANYIVPKTRFQRSYVVPYTPNETILNSLTSQKREAIILIYGRPSVSRNCFETICAGLILWQHRNPVLAREWRIISVGESFDVRCIKGISNITNAGKLSLDEYGDILSRSLVGISLMLSPHPSYPPLEMCQAGLFVISNNFEGKNIVERSDNIHALNYVTPEALADALDMTVGRASSYVGEFRQHQSTNSLQCDVEAFEPSTFAKYLEEFHDERW